MAHLGVVLVSWQKRWLEMASKHMNYKVDFFRCLRLVVVCRAFLSLILSQSAALAFIDGAFASQWLSEKTDTQVCSLAEVDALAADEASNRGLNCVTKQEIEAGQDEQLDESQRKLLVQLTEMEEVIVSENVSLHVYLDKLTRDFVDSLEGEDKKFVTDYFESATASYVSQNCFIDAYLDDYLRDIGWTESEPALGHFLKFINGEEDGVSTTLDIPDYYTPSLSTCVFPVLLEKFIRACKANGKLFGISKCLVTAPDSQTQYIVRPSHVKEGYNPTLPEVLTAEGGWTRSVDPEIVGVREPFPGFAYLGWKVTGRFGSAICDILTTRVLVESGMPSPKCYGGFEVRHCCEGSAMLGSSGTYGVYKIEGRGLIILPITFWDVGL